MKRVLVALMLVASGLIAAGPQSALASPPEGSIPDLAALGWQQVFNEEFNGSSLDESVWAVPQYHYDGLHTKDSIDLSGGNLVLTTYTDTNGVHRAGEIVTGGLSSHNPTPDKFSAAYGYVEARMKFPDGPYSGSTFWMMSHNGNSDAFGDPAATGPELDIVEHGNRGVDTDESDGDSDGDLNDDGVCDWPTHLQTPCSETLLSGGHWDAFDEDHKGMHGTAVKNPSYDPANAAATSLQGNFHTYGLLWTPDSYIYYVDGKQTFFAARGMTYTPEYLILATYVYSPPAGFSYGAKGAANNDVTLVDYVRWWQRPISEIPDQRAVASRPVTVPFTVSDYFYSSAAKSGPGSVRVTATSSNQSVVQNGNITVTGNGPADPDGSFQNGDFSAGTTGWSLTGNAAVTNGALKLSEVENSSTQKGRGEQTITGLQPSTTYVLSGRYNLEVGWSDTNGNGRPDPGEPFTEPGETEIDANANVDWGIVDVDVSRAGAQTVTGRMNRNGWTEATNPTWWMPSIWPEEQLRFTTGPGTTQVTIFVSNEAYAGSSSDSDASFDSLNLHPLVPAQRAVSFMPSTNGNGSATITLTARNAANSVLGTETFTVTFQRGSTFTNGNFDAAPLGLGWELYGGDVKNGRGAEIVIDKPFQLNRVLQLARPVGTAADLYPVPPETHGTVFQPVSRLTAGVSYTLSVRGKGDLSFGIQEYAGPGTQLTETITTPDWSTKTITFTPTVTTAKIFALDWNGANGSSYVDDVALTPNGYVGAVPITVPTLASLTDQQIPSSSPSLVPFKVSGSALWATSDNPEVLPTRNIGIVGNNTDRALSLLPVPDRTGKATITIGYTDSAGPHTKNIVVIVSDGRLRNPGFELGPYGWNLPSTATISPSAARTGASGLQINGANAVVQTIGMPAHSRTECLIRWTVSAWAKGNARLSVRQPRATPITLGTTSWANPVAWTENKLTFTSPGCFDNDTKAFELVLEDTDAADGVAASFDDVSLVFAPAIRTPRDLSIYQAQSGYAWNTRRTIHVGRVAANSYWDPAVSAITSSNQAVLPAANLRWRPEGPDSGWPYNWELETKAGAKTGRSTVTVTLTDPFAGSNTKSFTLTVNAGTNFNNGDFERDLSGWVHSAFNDSWDQREMRRETMSNPPATNADQVLRISSGVAGYKVTGLTPGVSYVVQANARGSGSTLRAVANNMGGCVDNDPNTGCIQAWGTQLSSVAVNSTEWAATPNLTFTPQADVASTPGNESEVWIFVWDANDSGPVVGPSSEPCVTYVADETCVDDIGVFLAADVS